MKMEVVEVCEEYVQTHDSDLDDAEGTLTTVDGEDSCAQEVGCLLTFISKVCELLRMIFFW